MGAATEQANLIGGFHAFAATREARVAKKDPRPAITERYVSKND